MKKNINLLITLILFVITGCAGMRPAPKFTSGKETAKNKVAFETVDRSSFHENMMAVIEDLLGVPYRAGGSSPQGMDCSGLVCYVFSNTANLHLPHQVGELLYAGQKVPLDQLEFGDLIFFKNMTSGKINHVGIYLDQGEFVHASSSKGVMLSNLKEPYYKERFAAARRVLSFK